MSIHIPVKNDNNNKPFALPTLSAIYTKAKRNRNLEIEQNTKPREVEKKQKNTLNPPRGANRNIFFEVIYLMLTKSIHRNNNNNKTTHYIYFKGSTVQGSSLKNTLSIFIC